MKDRSKLDNSPVCDQIIEINELLTESNDKKCESYRVAGFANREFVSNVSTFQFLDIDNNIFNPF